MNPFISRVQAQLSGDLTTTMLRLAIITWAIVMVVAAFTIENKWILAGILAWELLP